MEIWMLFALLEGKHVPLNEYVYNSEEACQKARIELHSKMSPPDKPVALYTRCIPRKRVATETFTLIVLLYVGGLHEMIRCRNLNQADCTAIAEEVQRTQPGLEAWCRPRESQYARIDCGLAGA